MKLTTKSRYGMNAMYELVTRYGQGPVPLKMIAEKQNIPEAFLEQLMNQLRKAELVTSIRGSQVEMFNHHISHLVRLQMGIVDFQMILKPIFAFRRI